MVQRVLCAPLAAHAAALAVLLLMLVPLVGTTSLFFSDEGAAIAQALRLARGDGWTMPNSFPAADPEGDASPIELSARSGDEFAPFAKHPVYAAMLAVTDRVGGRAGMIVLSIAGTVAAAWLSALLALRVERRLAVPALWVVGIASPLLFYGYVVVAQTLGAACAAGAALLLLRQLDERRSWMAIAGVAVLLLIGQLLRTEMLLMGLAMAATVAVAGFRRKSRRMLCLAAVPASAVVAGFGLDRLLQGLILHGGGVTTSAVAGESGGLVSGRVFAFFITWLLPAYSLDGAAALVLIVAAMAAVAVLLARRTPPESDGVRLVAVVAAIGALARLAFGGSPVPGLLLAFPLALAGIAALRRDTFDLAPTRFLGATFGLFALGVLATQYSIGGGAEWGGRFFAIGLPLIVPVLLLALRNVGRRLDRTTAAVALASALVVACASGVLAIVTLRDSHQQSDRLVAAVQMATQQQSSDDAGAPVVLTTQGQLGRFAFPLVDHSRWLTVPRDRLTEYAHRLRDLGVGRVTFVSRNPTEDLPKLDGLYTARDTTEPVTGWTVVSLEPCTGQSGCPPGG